MFVLSSTPNGDADRLALEARLLAALRSDGVATLRIPHLYYLRPTLATPPARPTALDPAPGANPNGSAHGLRDSGAEAEDPAGVGTASEVDLGGDTTAGASAEWEAAWYPLRALPPGGFVLAGWLDARALRWIAEAYGLRPLSCHDLRPLDDAPASLDAVLASLREALSTRRAMPGSVSPAARETDPALLPRRWYPVIDRDRCTACGACREYCLFGVYGLEERDGERRVVVAHPDACKDGCPACARVCPRQAILFPEAPDLGLAPDLRLDAAVASLRGQLDPGSSAPPFTPRPVAPLSSGNAPSANATATSRPDAGPPDELDDLIHALEDLDR